WAEGIEDSLLASGAADGHVIIWREFRSEWQILHHKYVPGSARSIGFSAPEPCLVLAIGGGDELGVLTFLVEMRRGATNPDNWQVKSLPAHTGGIKSLSWAPSSGPVLATGPAARSGRWLGANRLATCGADGQMIIWRIDARNDNFLREHILDSESSCLAWRPNVGLPGNCLAACADGVVVLIAQDADGLPFETRQKWSVDGAARRLSWTKAGTMLAVSVDSDKCFLYKEAVGGWKMAASLDGK
ncbi:unnamed protein product, partial [Effrenium voratum]